MLFLTERRQDHPIWSNADFVAELRRLSAIYFSLVRIDKKDTRRPLAFLMEKIRAHYRDLEEHGDDYQALNRFLKFGPTPDNARLLDGLALTVLEELDALEKLTRGEEDRPIYPNLVDAYDKQINLPAHFARFEKTGSYIQSRSTERQPAPPAPTMPIKVRGRDSKSASVYLTGHHGISDAERQGVAANFVCYRYSSIAGHIAKSSVQVLPTTSNDNFCRFTSRFKNADGALRLVSGICFREADWIYMLGQLEESASLKVMVLKAVGRAVPPTVQGILLSKSERPLVGRLALKRREGEISDQELKEVSEKVDQEFSSEEFDRLIRPRIRNSTEFALREKLLFNDTDGSSHEIEQSDMVTKVGELTRGKFALEDGAGRKQAFNPARHSHYPFNQAISFRDDI